LLRRTGTRLNRSIKIAVCKQMVDGSEARPRPSADGFG